jgi:pilus assembly protein CpaB
MRAKSLMMALLGFAVAGGSVVAANNYLSERARATMAAGGSEFTAVVVASQEISFGEPISANAVTVQTWPREALPPGAFTSLQDVVPASVNGEMRRAKRSLALGEILLRSKVSEFGEKVTIVQTLDPNSRAVAIQVDAVSGVAGFVTPGDRVDIILTQGGSDGLKAVTILQNVRIIAVDQVADEMKDDPGIARTVTVEVSPDDSQKLALAQKAGQLSLTLRTANGGDPDEPLDMTRLSDLLLEKSPVEEAARQPTIRVRRGAEVQSVIID